MKNYVQTALPPEKVVSALKEACPADGWMFLPAEGKITFLFYCRKNSMCLHPVLWIKNTMRKDLYLTFEENAGGTEICITPRYTLFFKVFAVFWFTLLSAFVIMAVIAGEPFLLFPLSAIFAAAVVFLIILRRFARNDEEAINAEAVKLLTSLK